MKKGILTVFIGYDEREPEAYDVAEYTLLKHASRPINVQPLILEKFEAHGMISREIKNDSGQMWDVVSDAPMSTKFAISRFLVPLLQQSGWAIFMDCDMLISGDIYEIEQYLDDQYPVMCVHHDHNPTESIKMDDQIQTVYPKKNWSSFFAVNASHPMNQRLGLTSINSLTGRELHGFSWLADEDIGQLPARFNWLVNVHDKPDDPIVCHYTLGGPWFTHWEPQPYDELWIEAYNEFNLYEEGIA